MSSTGHLPELESLRSQVADLARELAERNQSMQAQSQHLEQTMQDLQEQSHLLRTIIEGTAAETGNEFFASLVSHLTAALNVQYAVIGEVLGEQAKTFRTLAVSAGGTLADNFEYALDDAPCGTGLGQPFWCFEHGVQAQFPHFPSLATLGVDSHCGVSLRDKAGVVVGLLIVMDIKPLRNSDRLKSLMEVFASRATAELQRYRAELAHRESERRLRFTQFAIDHAQDAVLWADDTKRLIYANGAACQSLGYSKEEILALSISDIAPYHDATRFQQRLDFLKQGTAATYESIHRRKDGTEFPVEVSINYLEHERRGYTCAVIRDITERKRIEQERLQALYELQNIMETVPDFMFTLDTHGNLVKWNRRVAEVTGFSSEELLNKPALAFVPPQEQSRTAAAIQQAFKEGYTKLDGQLLTKDLRTIPYHWTGALLKNPHGEPIGITGIGRDVSDKKQKEAELRQQRRHLVDAQAIGHLGSWNWDIENNEVQWSDEQFRIFGHEPGTMAVTYDTFLTSLHPEDHDRALVAINDALLGKCPYDLECRIVRPNGEVRYIHVRGDVCRDTTGHPLSMEGTILDITERKQVEDALRASEERWQLAVRGSNDGIWDWNIQTGDVFFSSRWKAMRGFEDHEITNHVDEWRSRIHHDDLDRVLQSVDAYLAKRAPEFCEEYRVQRKDGSYLWILDRGMALWAEDGTPLRMAGSESDITERKEAEEALRESEARNRSIVETALDAVITIDEEGRVIGWNPQAEAIFGYSAQEAIGLALSETIIPIQFREAHAAGVRRVFQDGKNPRMNRRLELSALHRDGHEFPVEFAMALTQVGGQPVLSAFVRDITERRQAEQALREREAALARFKSTLDQTHDCVFMFAPDSLRFTYCNRGAVKQVGYTEAELSTMTPLDIEPEFTEQSFRQRLQPLQEGRRAVHVFETVYRHKDGHNVDVEVSLQLVPDGGERGRFVAVVRDITERKRAEETQAATHAYLRSVVNKLRETNHTLTAIIQSSPTAIVMIDLEGNTTLWNPAAERVFGWREIDVLGRPLPFMPPDRHDDHTNLRARAMRGEPLTGLELLCQRKDGSQVQVELSTALLRDAADNPCGILGLLNDITDRKQAEEALRASEERFNLAVQGSNTGIWDWDLETNKTYFSPLWKSMLGYEYHELRGEFSEWEERLHPDDRERSLATVRAYLDGSAPQYELEHRLRHKNGSYRWILARGVSISNADGKPYRMAGSHIDITELKQTQEALAHREHQLRIVLDTLPVGVWFTDQAGNVLLANPAGRQIWKEVRQIGLGHDPKQTGWWEQVGPTAEPHRWVLTRALTKGESSLNETLQIECYDGSRKTMRNSVVPVRNNDGKILGAIVLNEDITDRIRAEEALRRSHALLSAIMNAATDIIFVKDREGRYLHMNPAGARALNMTVEEIIGWNDYAVWPPDLSASCRAADQRVLNAGETVTFEEVSTLGDRCTVYLTTKAPYRDESGAIIGIIGVSRDITERKHAEEALRASEERFAKAFRSSPDPMIIAELASGRVIDSNDASHQLFGYRREDLEGRTTLDVGLWPSPEARARFIEQLERQRSVQNFEVRLRMKNGGLRRCLLSSELIELHGKRCMVTVGRDITDQKRAEEALRESEIRLTEAQRIARIGSWELNLIDKHLSWSDEVYRIFEIDPQRFGASYKAFLELVHPHDRDLVNRAYTKSVASRTPYDTVHRLLLPDGRIKFVRERCETSYAEDGHPLRSIGTVQDITEQKHAEEALHQREQDLRHAMEERERIGQDLHDGILQSLYAVGLGLESCKPLMRQRSYKQATILLDQAVNQMNHVMAEVRNFIAGLESQVLQGRDFPTALRTMVQTLTASQPIRCRLLIDKSALRQVSTEQALHLLNVVREALSNSLRHGRATRATVSFKLLTRSIRLLVTDNGRGFHPDHTEGIGHGLANMAARAHRMGGRFAVHSRPTRGTRVTVDLPKEEAYAHG